MITVFPSGLGIFEQSRLYVSCRPKQQKKKKTCRIHRRQREQGHRRELLPNCRRLRDPSQKSCSRIAATGNNGEGLECDPNNSRSAALSAAPPQAPACLAGA
ncbi:hypothetical protein UY3_03357 [Chelonia mydas]|uniref:Uncharacterized protein n=1 Tax=Chelonia mydas TaxID=8469 RepID=M7BNF2_CHEMY|nr:hypothetical protein UY3_03357 [Chelonia mydas]